MRNRFSLQFDFRQQLIADISKVSNIINLVDFSQCFEDSGLSNHIGTLLNSLKRLPLPNSSSQIRQTFKNSSVHQYMKFLNFLQTTQILQAQQHCLFYFKVHTMLNNKMRKIIGFMNQICYFYYLLSQYMSRVTRSTYFVDPSKKQKKLWVDSPCTLPFTNKLPYIQQANRFEYNSIYYRDDPCRPARRIDEFQKPDLLLLEFRRNIKQAEKSKIYNVNRNSSIRNSLNRSQNYSTGSPKEKQIVQRLYPKNSKPLKLQYDLHGNRSSFFAQQNQKSPKKQKKTSPFKKFDSLFTDSDRIDMSRPENFNPGPGTYFAASITSFSKGSVHGQQSAILKRSQFKTLQHHKNASTLNPRNAEFQDRSPLINKTIIN